MTNAIRLRDVTCRRGGFTLGPLDVTIPQGAIVALIGPNGAGKTTTLDLIMGLGRPDGGEIEVLDLRQPRDEVPIKAFAAYVGPDLSYAPWGRVGAALDFVSGFYADWDAERCERLLRTFGLSRPDRIATLSFGARMKLALVIALSRHADLLLLDEPTVGLDVKARLDLFSELLELVGRERTSVVISSHQLADLERLADHVIVMGKGKVLAAGPMDELTGRHVQVDARAPGGAVPTLAGVKLLSREGDRLRLLVDTTLADEAGMESAGLELLSRTPMSLEEVFVAMTEDAA